MKRGLVLLDPNETAPHELTARVNELEQSLAVQGVDAALVYGDVYRSGDITYLSNLCLYWNEGVLAVQPSREPALLCKLSPRVHTWMRATSNLKDLRSGPSLAGLAAEFLEDRTPGVLGLVEMEWWPGVLVDQLGSALSGWELRDLGDVVSRRRRRPSAGERALLALGAKATARAVSLSLEGDISYLERAGKAELSARLDGVEDVLVFCHPAGDGATTTEVASEYRGYWTLAARVLAPNSPRSTPSWMTPLAHAYRAVEQALAPGVNIDRLRSAARERLGDNLSWRLELFHHGDLETFGDFRSLVTALGPLEPGAVVALRLELDFSNGSQAVMADTYEVEATGARRLTDIVGPPGLQ